MKPNRTKYVKAALVQIEQIHALCKKEWNDARKVWADKSLQTAQKAPAIKNLIKALEACGLKFKSLEVYEHGDTLLLNVQGDTLRLPLNSSRFKHGYPPDFGINGVNVTHTAQLRQMIGSDYDRLHLKAQLSEKPFNLSLAAFLNRWTDLKELPSR